MKKLKRGRPSILTPALQKKICDIVRAGNYLCVAAGRVGIDPNTITAWRKKYLEFDSAIKKAIAEAEENFLQSVSTAAKLPKTWQAAAWALERRWPERWGRRDRNEITGTIKVEPWDLSKLSDAELEVLEKLVAKAKSKTEADGIAKESGGGTALAGGD